MTTIYIFQFSLFSKHKDHIPACCFFFLFTAVPIISNKDSSLIPLRIASRSDTSESPNKQT